MKRERCCYSSNSGSSSIDLRYSSVSVGFYPCNKQHMMPASRRTFGDRTGFSADFRRFCVSSKFSPRARAIRKTIFLPGFLAPDRRLYMYGLLKFALMTRSFDFTFLESIYCVSNSVKRCGLSNSRLHDDIFFCKFARIILYHFQQFICTFRINRPVHRKNSSGIKI